MVTLSDADFRIEFGREFDIAEDFFIMAPIAFAIADNEFWLKLQNF